MDEVPPSAPSWRVSSASGASGECVQVVLSGEYVWVRDSKDPRGLILELTSEAWTAFLGGVQCDEFLRHALPA